MIADSEISERYFSIEFPADNKASLFGGDPADRKITLSFIRSGDRREDYHI